LLYEAIYSSVSCARLEESLLVLYCCLLQIIIVEFPTFCAQSLGLSQHSGCLLFGIWDSLASLNRSSNNNCSLSF